MLAVQPVIGGAGLNAYIALCEARIELSDALLWADGQDVDSAGRGMTARVAGANARIAYALVRCLQCPALQASTWH